MPRSMCSILFIAVMTLFGGFLGFCAADDCNEGSALPGRFTTSTSTDNPMEFFKITSGSGVCAGVWNAAPGAGYPLMPPTTKDYIEVTCAGGARYCYAIANGSRGIAPICDGEEEVGDKLSMTCASGCYGT